MRMSNRAPLISIIVACYNGEKTIRRLMQSIADQTFVDYELVLVDGLSTDSSVDIVKSYNMENLTLICESDKGIFDAMNKGIALSKGSWIIFMGVDDWFCDKDVLSFFAEKMRNTDVELITGDIVFENGYRYSSVFARKILFINSIHHQGAFYRGDIISGELYNTDYTVSSDYELNLKMYLQGCKAISFKKDISFVGVSGVSSFGKMHGYLSEIRIRNKLIKNIPKKMFINTVCFSRFLVRRIDKVLFRGFFLSLYKKIIQYELKKEI